MIKALFETYPYNQSKEEISQKVLQLFDKELIKNQNESVYKTCFSCIDLTTLSVTDTKEQVAGMTNKVNNFKANFPNIPNVGAICVYPSLVPVVKERLNEDIAIASVAAGFPASQTFIEVKIAETSMAVMEGATEIDIVIPVGKFLEGELEELKEEIQEIKAACRNAHLKVILETGALQDPNSIYKASILSIASGADFIKTSTGKIPQAATPDAAYVMCTAIKDYYTKTGEKIGFKPAGGIVTTEDAVKYYTIVKSVLGEEWLNSKLFRIGASRLANNLLSEITKTEVNYF